MVHYGQIPDETDGAEGHQGEPSQRDPQRDQGWKPVENFLAQLFQGVENVCLGTAFHGDDWRHQARSHFSSPLPYFETKNALW